MEKKNILHNYMQSFINDDHSFWRLDYQYYKSTFTHLSDAFITKYFLSYCLSWMNAIMFIIYNLFFKYSNKTICIFHCHKHNFVEVKSELHKCRSQDGKTKLSQFLTKKFLKKSIFFTWVTFYLFIILYFKVSLTV